MNFILMRRGHIREDMTDEDYAKACERERAVAQEIEELSQGKFNIKFIGYGAGIPRKFTAPPPQDPNQPLDLEVKKGDTAFAIVEVMGSERYSFANSKFFPVAKDKVDRSRVSKLPTFFVFVLDNENQPNKWWIRSQRIAEQKGKLSHNFPTIYGLQDVYKSDKFHWHRGLNYLVDEFLKMTS